MIFKDIVLDEMEKQGITPLELSRRIDRPRSTVNNFLGPNSKSPSMDLGGPIAKELGISLDAIYEISAPGMSSHELHRIQEEHKALIKKYEASIERERESREAEERELMNARQTGLYIEQLESKVGQLEEQIKNKDSQITFLSYVEQKSMDRIKWQKWVIATLVALVLILGVQNLVLDASAPNIGVFQYTEPTIPR